MSGCCFREALDAVRSCLQPAFAGLSASFLIWKVYHAIDADFRDSGGWTCCLFTISHSHGSCERLSSPPCALFLFFFPSSMGSSDADDVFWTELQNASRASTRLVARRTNTTAGVLRLRLDENGWASSYSRKRPYLDLENDDALQQERLNSSRGPSESSSSATSFPDNDGVHAPKAAKRARAKSDAANVDNGKRSISHCFFCGHMYRHFDTHII